MSARQVAQSVPHRFQRGPCVYFVGAAEEGPVKIGFTCELPSRLRSLQNSCPIPIKLLAAVQGGRDVEKAYHARFAADRLHGEWFARSEAIIGELVEIKWVKPLVDNIQRFAARSRAA
jgi:hypothetical protein